MSASKRISVVGLKGMGLLGLVAAGLATSPAALAQSGGASGEYMAHWAVTTWVNKTRGVDLQAQINLAGTQVKRDTVILYESWLGNFPYAGVHLTDQGDYMARHLTKVAADIARFVPDANFSGYGVIDYETWYPAWSRLANTKSDKAADARDEDFKDDWEDHIKRNRPQVLAGLSGDAYTRALAASYDQAAQRFYLQTLNECKRLRPKAKWGFYGYPYGEYYVSYAPYRDRWKAMNTNEMNWLFDASDALFPHVYSVMVTVEDRQPIRGKQENTPAQNAEYITENVKEAVRVSRGKPVLPFVHFKYHPNVGKELEGKRISDLVIRQMIQLPKLAGATGVMIWDCIESDSHFTLLRDVMAAHVVPMMNQIAVIPQSGAPRAAAAGSSAAATKATKLPNGQVVVGKSSKKAKIASVPN